MSNNSTKPGYDDSYANQVDGIIDTLVLDSETDRGILKSRFLSEVLEYEKRKLKTKKYYDIFRFIVTTGSILLPAILSLGQMDPAKLPAHFDQISYWASWTISLMVTASNGFLQLFSLDKNYFEYALTTEQLKTEGWQFFQLSGKYEDDESHKDAYKIFSKSIENIKRKQVEKEFSGKGDVNKNKKEKKFDFQGELMNQINMTTSSCSSIYSFGNPTTIETIAKTTITGTKYSAPNGATGNAALINPYRPIFSITPAKRIEPAVGAST